MGSNEHECIHTSATLEDDTRQEYCNSPEECSEQKTILKQMSPCTSTQDIIQQETYYSRENERREKNKSGINGRVNKRWRQMRGRGMGKSGNEPVER